jgi:CDP-4-dehydro-6-deoxyglucose reductase/ferredoxin-NAD(P)+ reductase (naphthalene dioxygenase ferredoxin-specific)
VNHLIHLEGDPQPVPAQDGEIVLDALLRNGVGFAYSCQAGNCGSCKCVHVAGAIEEIEYSSQALTPAERARGLVLACRTRVRGDLRLRRTDGQAFVMHPARSLQCRLDEKRWLTHDVARLRFVIESGGPFTFCAGQFAKLEFPFAPGAARDYSMASSPDEPILEFHVRVMHGGVSGQLRDRLQAGDRVRISGPFGTSYLHEAHRGPMIALAGGTGMGPIRSIVRRALDRGLPGPIHVYVGAREERDVYGEAELCAWAQRHPALHVAVGVVERTEARPGRRVGRVTDLVREDFDRLDGFHAYVAGPPAMVDAAVETLHERGVAGTHIRADAFHGASPSPT